MGSVHLNEFDPRLDLTLEIRDLQAIARKRGWQLVVVTRRKTAITPAL